jgi:hypothetical protein
MELVTIARPEWLILSRLDRRNQKYPVQLEWTACNYGGSRVWFRCPTKGQLAYDSQQDSGWIPQVLRNKRGPATVTLKDGASGHLRPRLI